MNTTYTEAMANNLSPEFRAVAKPFCDEVSGHSLSAVDLTFGTASANISNQELAEEFRMLTLMTKSWENLYSEKCDHVLLKLACSATKAS